MRYFLEYQYRRHMWVIYQDDGVFETAVYFTADHDEALKVLHELRDEEWVEEDEEAE